VSRSGKDKGASVTLWVPSNVAARLMEELFGDTEDVSDQQSHPMERGSGFPEVVPDRCRCCAWPSWADRCLSTPGWSTWGEEGKRDELVKHLIPECMKLGYDRDRWTLEKLILLGLEESKKQNRCKVCKGVGTIGIHKCENCFRVWTQTTE
jgi:hypothetical protein